MGSPLEVKTLVDEGRRDLGPRPPTATPTTIHERLLRRQIFYGHDCAAMEGMLASADG